MNVILGIRHSIESTCISLVGVGIAVEVAMVVEEGEVSSTTEWWHRTWRRRWEGKALARTPGGRWRSLPKSRGMLIGSFIGHASQLLHFFFFSAAPGMCDLSCLTRGWTKPPVTEAWSLNHWTTREVPQPLQLIGKDTPLCGGFKQPKSRCSTLRASAEKAMAPHSSTLAWQIPWTEEPSGLQFMGSLRVRHDWATSLSLFTLMHWRRKWQPTPEFLPGESQGWGNLMGCHLWGCTESDTTEAT